MNRNRMNNTRTRILGRLIVLILILAGCTGNVRYIGERASLEIQFKSSTQPTD